MANTEQTSNIMEIGYNFFLMRVNIRLFMRMWCRVE